MKKRNGFVSNSSSSSFIVAFPRKPKTVDDVFEMMFNNKDGVISSGYYNYCEITHYKAAEIVFNEIKENDFKEASDEDVINELKNRYIYVCSSSSRCREKDVNGGFWLDPISKYCGSSSTEMEELRQITINAEKKTKEIIARINAITKERGPKPPSEQNISKEMRKFYYNKVKEFYDLDKEYIALNEEYSKATIDFCNKTKKLRNLIAESDKNKFIKDNENCFIFLTTYSANDGDLYAAMEYGNVFRNLPHIMIDNH